MTLLALALATAGAVVLPGAPMGAAELAPLSTPLSGPPAAVKAPTAETECDAVSSPRRDPAPAASVTHSARCTAGRHQARRDPMTELARPPASVWSSGPLLPRPPPARALA